MGDEIVSCDERKDRLSKVATAMKDFLRKLEKRHHSILDIMMIGCQIIGFDWTYLYLNEASAVQYRRPRNEFLGRKMINVWPGIENTEFFALLKRSMTERLTLQKEVGFDFPSGEKVWFNVKCHPVPEGIFIQHEEITGRISTEKKLIISKDRFKRALENIPDVVVIYDDDLKIQYINAATRKITGRPESFFLGKRDEEILPPEVYQKYLPMLKESLESGKTLSLESELSIPGRKPSFLRITCAPLFDETGKVLEVIGITHDLTKEKMIEKELREKKQFVESIINFTPYILYVYDIVDRKNVYSNNGIQTNLGYSRDEISAMGEELLHSLMHPDDFKIYTEKTLPSYEKTPDNMAINNQWRFKHKNGEWRRLDFTEFIYSRRPDGSPRQIFGVAHDITEKLLLEEQFRQAQKIEAIGILAGGMAHDFNNLLSIILGYGENILYSLHDGDPLKEDAGQIVEAGKRSAALIRQLLAFSRKQTLQVEIIDLNELVRNIDKMLRRLIGEDVDLVLNLSNDPTNVRVDPSQIEQVVMNLAVNSRDAMPKGGRLTIETSCTQLGHAGAGAHQGVSPGKYVVLTITDTGFGMDKQTLERVFDPFFTTKGLGRGTGLGLATVYGIVKQSGGDIHAYSEPGQGTAFKIYLPTAEGTAEAQVDGDLAKVPKGEGEHILLVEDDASLHKGMA